MRAVLAVPLLREDRLLGGLVAHRRVAGEYPARLVELLSAFATQSTLAIHNARLYRELETKSHDLELANRHKTAFLANMSHELRTPLNAIIGFTRIVLRRAGDALDPKQHGNLEKVLGSAQHLLSLINAVLDLARIEAGRLDIKSQETPLAGVLDQCLRTIEPLLRDDAVKLEQAWSPDLPCISTDEEKLRQIVLNLLANAVKFTPSGTVRLAAEAQRAGVRISVADTGIGIAPERLDSIFEEFEQADTTTARDYGGTGLGLAISLRLARALGGDIRAISTLGAGSTFTLWLPHKR
jgi:signal transduction histidine kinase